MNTEDSEFARLEHEALLRASQPEQPSKAGELSDDDCRDIYNAAMYLPNRNIVSVMRYIIAHTVAQPVQKRLAELHLYEEINQYYAQCNSGAENLRDWVAKRMDTEPVQPVQPSSDTQSDAWAALEELKACAQSATGIVNPVAYNTLRRFIASSKLVQPVQPKEPNEAQTDAGVMALLQCSESDLESFSPKMCERYASDVARVYRAMIAQPVQSTNEKLLQIIAATYQIAGVYDAPEHVLNVLANPELATQEQIDVLLPFAQTVQPDPQAALNDAFARGMSCRPASVQRQPLTMAKIKNMDCRVEFDEHLRVVRMTEAVHGIGA